MKQIIIAGKVAYDTTASPTNYTSVGEGKLALFDLVDSKLIKTDADLLHNFAVVLGRGDNKMPINFPEVDLKSLEVTKATYQAGATFASTITVPTPVVGKDYTIVVSKKGVVFNERNNWTFTCRALTTTAADVATNLVKQINANKENLGITATNTGGAIKLTATKVGPDYAVAGADELLGVAITSATAGKVPVLDAEYVKDLASRCAAGKGFNDVYADGDSIYPGYPEPVAAATYTMYTLRFAVPRVSAKQRDEVVYQTLHICIPTGAGAITTMDAIFFPTPSEG